MSAPTPIAILVATPRTLTVELTGSSALDRLAEPLRYELSSMGALVQDGEAFRPVLTLEDLVPETDYELAIAGHGVLAFTTPGESAFIDIRDYGARPDAADNAQAIAAAIAEAPVGATLYIPPGLWRTGPLFLKSGLVVHLPSGAVLKGVAERTAYPVLPAFDGEGRQQASWEGIPAACYAALISIADADDVVIAGKGTIDGAGADGDWWTWPKETRQGARRPRTIFANRCRNLSVAGVRVCNSPSWTIHPLDSENLVFADLDIENPPESPNTDGLNPESSTAVVIVGVRFSVGDDCIAIKAGKIWPDGRVPAPTRCVEIRHCLMERGHGGVVIGSEMSGGVTDVSISRCRMTGTDRGLRIKTRRGRGGEVARIAMRDCVMDGVGTGLAINAHYFCDPDGRSDAVQNRAPAPRTPATPSIRDVTLERVEMHNVHNAAAYVLGLAESPVGGLVIEDLAVDFAPDAIAAFPDMALGLPLLRHAGVVIENAKDVRLLNVALPHAAPETV